MFPKIVVPQNGLFIMENPIKMDDLGVSLFSETSISVSGFFEALLFILTFSIATYLSHFRRTPWMLRLGGWMEFPCWFVCGFLGENHNKPSKNVGGVKLYI